MKKIIVFALASLLFALTTITINTTSVFAQIDHHSDK